MSNTFLDSRVNYMKRDPSSGSTNMSGPATSYFFGSFYGRDLTIGHNLGYVPLFRLYYEPWGDGKLIEAQGNTAYILTSPPNNLSASGGPGCSGKADSNNLVISLYYADSSKSSNTFPVYWIIYRDYGLSS